MISIGSMAAGTENVPKGKSSMVSGLHWFTDRPMPISKQALLFAFEIRHSFRHAGAHFDLAGQCSWMHVQEIDNHLPHVFRLNFPGIFGRRLVIVEVRCH